MVEETQAHRDCLSNDRYSLSVKEDGRVEVKVQGTDIGRSFAADFMIQYQNRQPQIQLVKLEEANYSVPAWEGEDGSRTNVYDAGPTVRLTPRSFELSGGKLRWHYPACKFGTLTATVSLPEGRGEPVISFMFLPEREGWYAVGYTGAPEMPASETEGVWQPLIWQGERFPRDAYLTMEYNCTLPMTVVSAGGATHGVAADPLEMDYRIPMQASSRFGVALRAETGEARPALFAPYLGGEGSQRKAGEPISFAMRLLVYPGDWTEAYREAAEGLYGFRDQRENTLCNLNETIENMVDYAMNDRFSLWNSQLRGSSYQSDVPGSVKNVSPLHPLSVSYVYDRRDVFEQRGVPMTEYALSREKYLFAIDESIVGQGASHYMQGPCNSASELASLYRFSGRNTPVFRHYAQDIFNRHPGISKNYIRTGPTWQNALAVYRITGEPERLREAKEKALRYIEERCRTPQETFEAHSFFWTEFVPKWADLFELYEATGESIFLEEAHRGARLYCTFVWMCPPVPEGELTVNTGGQASIYPHTRAKRAIEIPEETVPAWRVSELGLTPESSATATGGHRAIFMAHYAAYFLRLAQLTGDSFLHDIARWAIVGRYANFPGYHINTKRTTVYEKPDYPLRSHGELSYNTFHYNHIWPHIALATDYLIADVMTKSGGRISFPSEYAEGYAYMQSKVYGTMPGTFLGEPGVWLWMPRQLLKPDHVQINYIAGRGEGRFYAAFANQSGKAVRTKVRIDTRRIRLDSRTQARIANAADTPEWTFVPLQDDTVELEIAPHGVTALVLEHVSVNVQFHPISLEPGAALPERSFVALDTPVGKVHAMLISFGRSLTRLYVYLTDTGKVVKEAALNIKSHGSWSRIAASAYPFEFSVPLEPDDREVSFYIEAVKHRGDLYGIYEKSETVTLPLRDDRDMQERK